MSSESSDAGGSSVALLSGRDEQFGFRTPSGLIAVLDDLMCTGSESSLFDCPHPGATVENCNPPFSDANLICGTSGMVHVVVVVVVCLCSCLGVFLLGCSTITSIGLRQSELLLQLTAVQRQVRV